MEMHWMKKQVSGLSGASGALRYSGKLHRSLDSHDSCICQILVSLALASIHR